MNIAHERYATPLWTNNWLSYLSTRSFQCLRQLRLQTAVMTDHGFGHMLRMSLSVLARTAFSDNSTIEATCHATGRRGLTHSHTDDSRLKPLPSHITRITTPILLYFCI